MKTSGTSALLVTLTMLAGATGCAPGTVGAVGSQTVCAQAADHLAACGVTELPDTGACTATKERLASQILNRSCADVAGRTTFSNSGCDSIWSLFNPSCWGSDDDSGTDDGWTGGSSGEGSSGQCFCDDVCESYGDCCDSSCGGGKNGSSSHCFCDDVCESYGDCCDSSCGGGKPCYDTSSGKVFPQGAKVELTVYDDALREYTTDKFTCIDGKWSLLW